MFVQGGKDFISAFVDSQIIRSSNGSLPLLDLAALTAIIAVMNL